MAKLVTIYGGSGFVGRYIARRMAKAGWRVRVAVRRPNEALFVRTYGAVGQVEPILCNIRDDDSVRLAMRDADAVVNCVGTFDAGGRNNFKALHVEGAARIARIARTLGVPSLVHLSALGADPQGLSLYAQSKARGEDAVRMAFPDAVILRPSVVFGTEDRFFNRFAAMARFTPVLKVFGAESRFQPVFVDDVAKAAEAAITGKAHAGVYELGGPDVVTLRGLIELALAEINRRRMIVNLPFWIGSVVGGMLDFAQAITGRLFSNTILTRDQVRSLRSDNVVAKGAYGLEDLGIEPTPMGAVLPDYLWRFRPSGQYDAIKASARNLRKI